MRSQRTIAYVGFVAAIGIGLVGLPATRAQVASTGATEDTSATDVPAQTTPSGIAVIPESNAYGTVIVGQPAANALPGRIYQAAERLRDAQDDEAKQSARQELADLLGKYFDQDMARREKELAELGERLRKLTEQLERRRAKRHEIIDLQIQVSVNEADGLGFLSRPVHGHSAGQFNVTTLGGPYGTAQGSHSIKISDGNKTMVLPAAGEPGEHPASHEAAESVAE